MEIIERLREYMENEGRSCSFDLELITPEYVYRMWGGTVPFDEIEEALRVHGFGLRVHDNTTLMI